MPCSLGLKVYTTPPTLTWVLPGLRIRHSSTEFSSGSVWWRILFRRISARSTLEVQVGQIVSLGNAPKTERQRLQIFSVNCVDGIYSLPVVAALQAATILLKVNRAVAMLSVCNARRWFFQKSGRWWRFQSQQSVQGSRLRCLSISGCPPSCNGFIKLLPCGCEVISKEGLHKTLPNFGYVFYHPIPTAAPWISFSKFLTQATMVVDVGLHGFGITGFN